MNPETIRARLEAMVENPNPHQQSTGGTVHDVLEHQATLAAALLELLGPPMQTLDVTGSERHK